MAEICYLNPNPNVKIFAKLEGNNPGGSVKDRAALNMIRSAMERGEVDKNTKLIELDRIKKNEEWRKQEESAMKDRFEKRKAFDKASKDKMDAVLTAEQRKTLEASRGEMRDKMRDRKGGKGPRGPRPENGNPPPPPPAKNN